MLKGLSKTFRLIDHYGKVILEQDGQLPPDQEGFDSGAGETQDVLDNPEPTPSQEMPLTSAGEEKYIADLIDAALFEPSSEDSKTLANLQSAMQLKKYTNAREEILPIVLNIIRPSTEASDIRNDLNQIQ